MIMDLEKDMNIFLKKINPKSKRKIKLQKRKITDYIQREIKCHQEKNMKKPDF